jgi:uncharacterized protein (TIGR03000 family)
MRQIIPFLAILIATSHALAQDVTFPDGAPASMRGGILIIRQGNHTTLSLGGVFFSRHVTVKTHTFDGPVVTHFTLPSMLHSPEAIQFLNQVPATIHIEIPDPGGVLYVDGQLVRSHGTSRQLESPSLPPGAEQRVKLRGVFASGESLWIEDKTLVLRPGASLRVTFDGRQAVSVPLRRDADEIATGAGLKK